VNNVVRVGNAYRVPAYKVLTDRLALVEIAPAELELCGVVLLPLAPVHTAEVELPHAGAESTFDWNAIPQLPVESLYQGFAHNARFAVGQERSPLGIDV
jgi:hypothetical protein